MMVHCYNFRSDIIILTTAKNIFHPYILSMSNFSFIPIWSGSSKGKNNYIITKLINLSRRRKEFLKKQVTCMTIIVVSRKYYQIRTVESINFFLSLLKLK